MFFTGSNEKALLLANHTGPTFDTNHLVYTRDGKRPKEGKK